MFGVHSYRSFQGQKWLRAFSFIRGRKKTFDNWTTSQHSLVDTHSHPIPFHVHFASASKGRMQNIEKLTGHSSQITEKTVDGEIEDSNEQLSDNHNFIDDILLPVKVDVPRKGKMKRFIRQLDECLVILQEAQKSNSPITVGKVLPRTFPRIVALSMNQNMPFALRDKCMTLLLMTDEDNELTKRLLTRTLGDSQHLPISTLVDVIQKISASKPTELRQKVRKEFVTHIVNKRFHEIGQRHLVFVMYQLDGLFDMKRLTHDMRVISRADKTDLSENAHYFQKEVDAPSDAVVDSISVPEWRINLERHILVVVDEVKTKDLVRILMLMGKWKSRNETLLAAVIHRLCVADLSDLPYIQLIKVLFACSSLAVHNETLVDKVTKLLSSHPPVSPSLTTSVLAYLSYLRWYDPAFISKCLAYSGQHVSQLTGKEACSILMSLSNLYAFPSLEEEKCVITALGNQALSSNTSDVDTVNVMWSLAILQSLSNGQADSVLEPSFAKRFTDTSRFQNRSCLQKLQQISTAAKLELSSYDGPYYALDADISKDAHSNEGANKSEQELKSALKNALSKFLTITTHVKEGEVLPGGYKADAIMCAEADGSLKPVADLEKLKDSPKKLYRLAVKVIPFKGVIHPDKRLAGIYQMESRHLKAMGYTLVPVLYSDLHKNKSDLEQVRAIQERIRESLTSA